MFLKLAGYIYWQVISRLSSLLKNLSSGFWNNAKFVGMDQITYTNCNKSSWMRVNKTLLFRNRPEQFPSFLEGSFWWYQATMRWSRVSKACHFHRILANFVDSMLFHCFYDSYNFVAKYFLNALIEFVQTLPRLRQLWQVHIPLSDFFKKLLVQRNTKIN